MTWLAWFAAGYILGMASAVVVAALMIGGDE
jgi:hypothetical protein